MLLGPPPTQANTHWIHFYFNSKFDGVASEMIRPSLHLVIALDISGSMGVSFPGEQGKSKIDVAKLSLLSVIKYVYSALTLATSPTFVCSYSYTRGRPCHPRDKLVPKGTSPQKKVCPQGTSLS